jgi:hypothetical protein
VRLVLGHSPYLGPTSWEPTADQLRAMGYDVEVPDLRGSLQQAPCVSSFVAAMRAAVERAPDVRTAVVGHSRCGPFLPAAVHGCAAVTVLLYVDAALPYPGRSWADQAPPEQVDAMRRMAVAGRLPRWSDWWDDHSVLDSLVPDPMLRARLINEMPQVPSGFLDERLPELDWHGRSGYLQLSTAYADYADAAQDAGWPVERRDLNHLAILTAPTDVAPAIASLLMLLKPQIA